MQVITKGFTDLEVEENIKNKCLNKIQDGLKEFMDFGKLYGIVYDIAYRGNGVITISKMED